MSKVFEYKAGSLLDRVSGQQLTNSGVVFKQTEKGVAGLFNVGNSITLTGLNLDVINIISNLKGSGTLRIAVGSNNIDIIATNLWKQLVSIVAYTNETSITLSCISGSIYLQGIKLFDKLLDTYEINKEYKQFLALQNMRVAKTNFYYPNGIQDNDVIFYDDFRYENTDGTNVIPNDWLTGTGLFIFSEIDLNTKVLECTSAGTVSHLYNKYNYVGGGLLEFDYFDGAEWLHYTDTVDELILSTSILSYANNKISYNLSVGDKIKNIAYTKGIGDRKEVFGFWVNGSTSFDPVISASEIAEFDFGDGTSETTTNSPTHVYADTEDYLVKIYISDLGLVTSFIADSDKVFGEIINLDELVNLTTLNFGTNNITVLDISKNIKLTYLHIGHNNLTRLDVTNNIKLETIFCYSNQLTELDLTNNIDLITLVTSFNQLTELDLSNNVNLKTLKCYSNQLTELDVSPLTNLTQLFCYTNQISILDLQSPKLNYIRFDNNNMTSAQVDQVWINLDNSTTQIDGYADGRGNDAPTSASQSARDNLETNGWEIYI